MTRAALLFVFWCLSLSVSAVRSADAADDLLGKFTGRPMRYHAAPFAEGIVEELEVRRDNGDFTLDATMNAMNFETGMDHVSNTFWHLSGHGKLVRGRIRFTYEARYAGGSTETGHGVFRRAGRRFILKVDKAEYVVRRKGT